ncbi:MAG: putative oxidoreductase [Nocardioidaceae bacterium]|nr:putative oxidoreductase [Nocardioidaceae bacterium]
MNEHALHQESVATDDRPGGEAVDVGPRRPSPGRSLAWLNQRGELLVDQTLAPLTLPALRLVMGLVFLWFGGLKVAGASPVSDLVAGTLPWMAPGLVVPVLGAVEVLLGLGLVLGLAPRVVLPITAAHLTGTFLTFVMLPGLMLRHDDPLLLTADGEFVVKNLVLISATLVLLTHGSQGWGRSSVRPAAATSRERADS